MNQPPPQLSLPASIMQRFRNEGYQWPGPRLPAGAEVVDRGGVFGFEAPWPWGELSVQHLSGSTNLRTAADLAVTAPRTDGFDPVFALTVTRDDVQLEHEKPKAVARGECRSNGVRLSDFHKLVLDGRRALLIEGEAARTGPHTFLLYAPSGEQLVTGRCDVPRAELRGYRHHLMSMLSTWQWA